MIPAAVRCTCQCAQLFLRPPGRWAAPPLAGDAVAAFHAAARQHGFVGRCVAHGPYLLNLASGDDELRTRSTAVLADELQRAGALGLIGVVVHPGSAGAGSRADAVARCRDAITAAVDQAGAGAARLVLEGQAGAGGQLGTGPAELAALVEPTLRDRIGVCLDTAHLWGAGYDLVADGWQRVLGELGASWGRAVPDVIHANDTKVERGSRRDRHSEPGSGRLGAAFFARMLADERLADCPVVVEIPPGPDNASVTRVLAALRAGMTG